MTTLEISGVVENLHTHREAPWAEKGEHKYIVDVASTQTTTTDTNPEGFVKANAKGSHTGYHRGKRTTQEKTRPFYKFPRDAAGKPYMPKEGFEWCLWQKFMEITSLSKWDEAKGRATVFEVTQIEFGELSEPTTMELPDPVYKNRKVTGEIGGPTTLTVGLKRDMGMQYQVFERMDHVRFRGRVTSPMDEAKLTSYIDNMNEWRFGPTNRARLSIETLEK